MWSRSSASSSRSSARRRSRRRQRVIAIPPRCLRISSIASVSRSQLAASSFSCFRPLGGEAIELRFATGVRHLPVGGQQPAVFEPVQRRIERALRHLHDVARDQLQALRDRVAVNGTGGDDVKDQQVERALGEIGSLRHCYTSGFYLYRTTCRSARRPASGQPFAISRAERSVSATNVSVPLVQPPVGVVGAPTTNRFSWSCVRP